jgi:hypothetical protein
VKEMIAPAGRVESGLDPADEGGAQKSQHVEGRRLAGTVGAGEEASPGRRPLKVLQAAKVPRAEGDWVRHAWPTIALSRCEGKPGVGAVHGHCGRRSGVVPGGAAQARPGRGEAKGVKGGQARRLVLDRRGSIR